MFSFNIYPEKDLKIKCTYYKTITDGNGDGVWKKRCFVPINKINSVFIEYEGNGETIPPPKHSNLKKPDQAVRFERTLPSMMEDLRIKQQHRTPAEVYKGLKLKENFVTKKFCQK